MTVLQNECLDLFNAYINEFPIQNFSIMPLQQHTRVSNAHSQEFVDDVSNDLNGVVARLVANWVLDEQMAARQSSRSTDGRYIVVEIIQSVVPHKLVQYVSYVPRSTSTSVVCQGRENSIPLKSNVPRIVNARVIDSERVAPVAYRKINSARISCGHGAYI